LYDIEKISKEEIDEFYDLYRYKGFDRKEIIKQLGQITKNDQNLAIQLVILCALQGPKRASQTKLTNGLSPVEMGITSSGQQGSLKISCQRISAATADLSAYFLKKMDVPKRLVDHPLPGWLQFPTAGAIKLPQQFREMHIDFHKKFSPLIGGSFREDIYSQMVANSYLDPKLVLFD
jgi:hypothetical protein